jgi:hypothetical protein
MTDEQIANWRRMLSLLLGPYAFIAPEEDILVVRDRAQGNINKWANESDEKEPSDDRPL